MLTQYAIAAKERAILRGEHHMICCVSRRMHDAHLGPIDGKLLTVRQRVHLDVLGYLGTHIRGIGALVLVNLAIWIEANFNGERQRHIDRSRDGDCENTEIGQTHRPSHQPFYTCPGM